MPDAKKLSSDAAKTTVTDYLTDDHRRLDAVFGDALRCAAKESTFDEGARLYSSFQRGLERHIVIEEEILFPAFEAASGMRGGGPTAVMRHEHQGIRALMTAISSGFAARSLSEVKNAAGELAELLEAHNEKEENILYPRSDELAGAGREALLARMMAVGE